MNKLKLHKKLTIELTLKLKITNYLLKKRKLSNLGNKS